MTESAQLILKNEKFARVSVAMHALADNTTLGEADPRRIAMAADRNFVSTARALSEWDSLEPQATIRTKSDQELAELLSAPSSELMPETVAQAQDYYMQRAEEVRLNDEFKKRIKAISGEYLVLRKPKRKNK